MNDEPKQTKYRLSHYNYKGWAIDEYAERTNPKTQESRWDWKTIKYPGGLEAAAKGLADCYVGQKEYDTVQELIETIRAVELRVIEAMKEIVARNTP